MGTKSSSAQSKQGLVHSTWNHQAHAGPGCVKGPGLVAHGAGGATCAFGSLA